MCKKLNEHFKKYNQMYSFGFLLIITLLVAFLFLRIDALETDVDRMVNEPFVNHQLTKEQIKRRSDTATVKTEVNVSGEILPGQEVPGTTLPGEVAPSGTDPNGVVVPDGAPLPNDLGPRGRMLPPNMQ